MQLTNYGQNKLVDRFRGQASPYGVNLYAALASAASDSSITEVVGTGYARVAMSRALATWAGTQAAGSTTASTGTTHLTSNNATINFGNAGSAWGAANYFVLFDSLAGGNAVLYLPLSPTLTIANGDPVSFAAGTISGQLGLTGGCSDYLANKLIDELLRGQAYAVPATLYHALLITAPANAGGGTEVSGTGYTRVGIATTLAAWAGTQGAGTTVASSGTTGKTSNNAPIAYAGPVTTSWGTVGWMAFYDAVGNLLMWAPLNSSKTLAAGATPPTFAAGGQTFKFQ